MKTRSVGTVRDADQRNPTPQVRCTGCPMRAGRREFLMAAGSAVALRSGALDFAASLLAAEAEPVSKPLLRAVFAGPKDQSGYWMTFTGPGYNAQAHQAEYTRIMVEAAKELGVRLEVQQEPLSDEGALSRFLEQCGKSPPDGVIFVLVCQPWWRLADLFVEKRGDLPTILFLPVGTTFTGHHRKTRNAARTFQAATQDAAWLAQAVRMLAVLRRIQDARVCILHRKETGDRQLPHLGTTLHYLPMQRWIDDCRKAAATDEVRAIADYYRKEAKKVVEPKPEEILDAAKCYVVARKIMAAENCQAISVDCMSLVGRPDIPCGPCLAWSKLNDELSVGACEADVDAAVSLLLSHQLLRRPGFVQDPVPNTIHNTLIGAHCSCPTRLEGPDRPHAPFLLRSDNGTNRGCATQVLWPIGEPVTVMEFDGPRRMLLGAGKVLSNIDTNAALASGSGGCRTSVELEMDNVADSRDCKGFHQLFILGKWDRTLKAFCQLAGIEVVPM